MNQSKHLGSKRLRRLHRHELVTVEGASRAKPNGVGHRDHRCGRVSPSAHSCDDTLENRIGSQRPRRVMNQHELSVVGYSSETIANRL